MRSIGMCIGASTISVVISENQNNTPHISETFAITHEGNPRKIINDFFKKNQFLQDDKLIVTGRRLRYLLNSVTISEPEAIEKAYQYIKPETGSVDVIISAGGETFMVYRISRDGRVLGVHTGNKCASGTGEFFLQQLKRMDMTVDEAMRESDLMDIYHVSGRCSVFCKSDCTHALNKGIARGKVAAGLSHMLAGKIIELCKRNNPSTLMIIGGVSQNSVVTEILKEHFPTVIVPKFSPVFEALGASLWGLSTDHAPVPELKHLFNDHHSQFRYHKPLSEFMDQVSFVESNPGIFTDNEDYILGLDAGSTTTKAVLIRRKDNKIVASSYLRTNGDPVNASRKCYSDILRQLPPHSNPHIIGLGATGSGRQITGLHALTPAIINEIIAHAEAATYFDPKVDTIFEIGGQDAKYTYLTNGVPSDYAMNEACSAGTGSFLEEAAGESLNITTEKIGDIALQATQPPDFSEQCSAFINSDIKNAIQEGISIPDITAGLVYSICMNYVNRVKANRTVGNHVFMQGGVCYNRAVPAAMAALTGKHIIVPPDPGLMGAFGVALNTLKKINNGLLEPSQFDLKQLSQRLIEYKSPFVCAGGKEKCNRKCRINRLVINGKIYPFGGACDKYYNLLNRQKDIDIKKLDMVERRIEWVFEKHTSEAQLKISNQLNVGISRSLLTNTLFPLYSTFFTELGHNIVINDKVDPKGIERKGSAFCYPVELSYGSISELIKMKPDIIFLPHVKSVPVPNGLYASVTCPFIQGEPYYLKTAFPEMDNIQIFNPVLNYINDYEAGRRAFVSIGNQLGISSQKVNNAYDKAIQAQNDFHKKCREMGDQILLELEQKPEEFAVVLFGRPYNAFSDIANMGIPHKFASRGYYVIPYDFLPLEEIGPIEQMYWAMGQMILKAARFVSNHPQLYGVYVTNFSCGPDSFVISYFREMMGNKPSLTLEMDSHTADAGVDTRIEAFIDVVKSYRLIDHKPPAKSDFIPAHTKVINNQFYVLDSNNQPHKMTDKNVHLLIPSMGHYGSRLFAATFRYVGFKADVVSFPTHKQLKLGRGFTSCKECLPLQITAGSLLDYLQNRDNDNELLVYFMPETSGPCRFGQYNILMRSMIKQKQIPNVTFLSLTAENSYAGLKTSEMLRIWQAIVISDVMSEIKSAIRVLASDRDEGIKVYEKVAMDIESSLEHDPWNKVKQTLHEAARQLNNISRDKELHDVPKVALLGEIYVRQDQLARNAIENRLEDLGIVVKVAPIAEWLYYTDYIVRKELVVQTDWKTRILTGIKQKFKSAIEYRVKKIMSESGFYELNMINVDKLIQNVSDLISPRLTGEAILTTGGAITEVVEEVAGVISIGPFGCMPSRIADSIISSKMNHIKLDLAENKQLVQAVMAHYPELPFLSLEVDGNTFTQAIEARLESFTLQVKRIYQKISEYK